MSMNLNDISFSVILSTNYKNTSIIIKVKYLSNKQVNNFIYMLYYFKYVLYIIIIVFVVSDSKKRVGCSCGENG
jgi:hypothetical protein